MRCSPPSLAYHNSEEEEPDEISVVVLSHTVCHEGAVVVEPEDALAARVAVLGPRNLRKKGPATRRSSGKVAYITHPFLGDGKDKSKARVEANKPTITGVLYSLFVHYGCTREVSEARYTVHTHRFDGLSPLRLVALVPPWGDQFITGRNTGR